MQIWFSISTGRSSVKEAGTTKCEGESAPLAGVRLETVHRSEAAVKVPDILKAKKTISFEFFPPKEANSFPKMLAVLNELKGLGPDFVSVTYGAGGSTRGHSVVLSIRAQRESGANVLSHLTIWGHSKDEVHAFVARLQKAGIENVMALRGDQPADGTPLYPGGFPNTVQLIEYLRGHFDLGIGAACYPEGHPEAKDRVADVEYAKRKVDAGAGFLVTQLFYDNADFFAFLDRARQMGIGVPVIAGLMPIQDARQTRRFAARCGAKLPTALEEGLERYGHDDMETREFGIEYTTAQARQLWDNGAAGLHFYTLNKPYSVSRILANLGLAARFGSTSHGPRREIIARERLDTQAGGT
ncbi:MAG: methylenetetrahydrofolate reductase [NAD(P)H] [SAR202 cluster bacterium]|nr:methylenetetrahydrofolate reductase [NAD(P)H] [SAR202 cluster bacterium]